MAWTTSGELERTANAIEGGNIFSGRNRVTPPF